MSDVSATPVTADPGVSTSVEVLQRGDVFSRHGHEWITIYVRRYGTAHGSSLLIMTTRGQVWLPLNSRVNVLRNIA